MARWRWGDAQGGLPASSAECSINAHPPHPRAALFQSAVTCWLRISDVEGSLPQLPFPVPCCPASFGLGIG